MIKAIVFDWGRTIYDKENERLFTEALDILKYCYKKYDLAIVSIAIENDLENKFDIISRFGLRKYFKLILFHMSDKESLLINAIGNFDLKPEEVIVIDDRIKRLAFPIKIGCKTAWIKKGKFFNEIPDDTTGQPNYIINSLGEVLDIL